MKELQVIIGVVLGGAGITTLATTVADAKGAELGGVITGFLLVMGLAGFLIYNGTKRKKGDGCSKF